MIQEIKYGGVSANPSDYECADGQLALSIGLLPEDGALKPVLPPKILFAVPEGDEVVYIHRTAVFCYYLVWRAQTGDLFYTEGDTESTPLLQPLRNFGNTEIESYAAVGNTLIVLASDGMHYFLWKSKTEGYIYLGDHFPELPISFGLQGEMVRTDEFTINFEGIPLEEAYSEFSDSNKTTITQQVLAKVNKFITEESTDKGKFMFPFFVRYAYRLYDGTLTMHSSPILMVASSDINPVAFYTSRGGEDNISSATMRVAGVVHRLDYAVISDADLSRLNDWKDIIRSVDIFVSAPIYTYDQSGECTKFVPIGDFDTYAVCKHVNQAASQTQYPLRYQRNEFSKLYAFTFDPEGFTHPEGRVELPCKTQDAIKEDIRSCAQFYLLRSINVDQLKTQRTLLDVPEDYLQSLTVRELMTDDYDSHDKLIAAHAFSYNARLNVAGVSKRLSTGWNAGAQFCHTDGYVNRYADGETPTDKDGTTPYRLYFYIRQDGQEIVVAGDSYQLAVHDPSLLFIFYPNVNAYKAVIEYKDYISHYIEVELEPHNFLNGAFYFSGWDNPAPSDIADPVVSTDDGRTVRLPNKIYTSEVNNPFFFPLSGINTVGNGEIMGICAAVRAMSQGQFGQFPLYAFSTDGVWALEVSSTGTYSAKQPITRDVCINPDSITQIDSAVLFATDRGIMLISGSETVCLSDSINSRDLFAISDLPKADKLVSLFNERAGEDEQITLENASLLPFRDFLTACKMIYDYTNQRIIVYNPSVTYAYVYSMKSKTWGMIHSHIDDNVNSYPDALAMLNNSALANFSQSDATGITALVVTRPLKLGYPDVLKTIDTVIQRGYFQTAHVAQVLYGSRDLFNWHIVWSSTDKYLRGFRGSPYKYFRIALICQLDKEECIDGCTVQLTPRLTNKPR